MSSIKWKYIFPVSFVVILVIGMLFYINMPKDLYKIEPIKIPLQKGRVVKFEYKLEHKCIYRIGVKFNSTLENKYEHLREIFGYDLHNSQFPVDMELMVKNKSGQTVYEINTSESMVHLSRIFEDGIEFDFTMIELLPDKYIVKIIEKNVRSNLSGIYAYFFVEQFYNVRCD